VLDIEILGETAAPSSATVGPDGKIYYSLLPGLFVWGMTLSETKVHLEDNLSKFIRIKPEVSIVLRGVASKRVWIMGNVQAPGVFIMATPMTLLEAISLAGGTLGVPGSSEEMVDFDRSFVMRDGQLLKVDFNKLFRKGDLQQNIYLHSGDYVYLKPAVARNVYVLGMVASPNIVSYSQEISLVTGSAAAGGPIQYAYLSHVAVVRGSLSNPTIAIIDFRKVMKGELPNIRLEPGDIVYVPLAPYAKLQKFANGMLNQFVSTIALNEGTKIIDSDSDPVSVSVSGGGASSSGGGASSGGGGGGN